MIHLEQVRKKRGATTRQGLFPFSVPVIAALAELDLAEVTFFVGENGSGKSTLLEAIGLAANLPFVGTEDGPLDPALQSQRQLAAALGLVWRKRTHRGFFLRAEDFFGFQKRLARERVALVDQLDAIDIEYAGRSALARGLAKGPIAASIGAMDHRYGVDPDAKSHGEAFLRLFQSRFVPDSLILMDEPEAALSPQNQLGLVALVRSMVGEGAQFVIATHSPILLAVPDARIYGFDGGRIEASRYDELAHVRITRDFLNDPARYLRLL